MLAYPTLPTLLAAFSPSFLDGIELIAVLALAKIEPLFLERTTLMGVLPRPHE